MERTLCAPCWLAPAVLGALVPVLAAPRSTDVSPQAVCRPSCGHAQLAGDRRRAESIRRELLHLPPLYAPCRFTIVIPSRITSGTAIQSTPCTARARRVSADSRVAEVPTEPRARTVLRAGRPLCQGPARGGEGSDMVNVGIKELDVARKAHQPHNALGRLSTGPRPAETTSCRVLAALLNAVLRLGRRTTPLLAR